MPALDATKMRILISTSALLVLAPLLGLAQCGDVVKVEDSGRKSYSGIPLRTAVIFSKPLTIPPIKLRLIDESGKAVVPREVKVTYSWNWLEYPYPEHAWGAWSDASDYAICSGIVAEELMIPAYKLTPRGWYGGKYTRFPWPKKPRFNSVRIDIEGPNCRRSLEVREGDLKRFEEATPILKLSCDGAGFTKK